MAASSKNKSFVSCPICNKKFSNIVINDHANRCLNGLDDSLCTDSSLEIENQEEITQPKKKIKTDLVAGSDVNIGNDRGRVGGSGCSWGCLAPQNDTYSAGKLKLTKRKSKGPVVKSPELIQVEDDSTDVHTTITEIESSADHADNLKMTNSIKMSTVDSLTGKSTKETIAEDVVGAKIVPRLETNNQNIPSHKNTSKQSFKPLSEEMRPKTLEEYVGQEDVIGKNKLLMSLLKAHEIPSMILWGPPGCGKTTLAKVIANNSKSKGNSRFVTLSATTSGVNDVRTAIAAAKNEQKLFKRKTILFIDEIHRFNKAQQDTFLPHVEDGTIVLIGATTENPSFHVNNALLSRCRVIVLQKLSTDSILTILNRGCDRMGVGVVENVLEAKEKDSSSTFIEKDALTILSNLCDGDARIALNGLQTAVVSYQSLCNNQSTADNSPVCVTADHIKEGLQRSHVTYDKTGEEHYNCASAFQKSIRGSADSAALYWLARMLDGGEDPLFIARRLVVCASEDIGMADPTALSLAVSTFQACHFIGMPECSINLAHCTTYLARAPKSVESYVAYQKARECVNSHEGALPGVPLHLRNASNKFLKSIGYGQGYSHPRSENSEQLEYMPQTLAGTDFFK